MFFPGVYGFDQALELTVVIVMTKTLDQSEDLYYTFIILKLEGVYGSRVIS